MAAAAAAQEWMERRFKGLQPKHFSDHVRIHSVAALTPPPGFEEVWTTTQPDGELPVGTLITGNAVLLFCDLRDDAQATAICDFVNKFEHLGPNAPPLVYVHHSCVAEEDAEVSDVDLEKIVVEFLTLGVDTAIVQQFEGFPLAVQVRARLRSIAQVCSNAAATINEQRARNAEANYRQRAIDHLIWSYTLRKLSPNGFPVVDENIGHGIPQLLDGYIIGKQLGAGAYGCVFELTGRSNNSVVKAVDKQSIGGITGLGRLARSTRVQQALSSTAWRHPNIIELFAVYHSPTHIFYRMEHGGPKNFHARLKEGPITARKASSALEQASFAVSHMHLGPGICHMDIKTENFIVEERPTGIRLKLADFDLALFHRPGAFCKTRCGTLPFTAPEILLQDAYMPLPTDLWSLGMVMLEVTCGVGFLSKAVGLETPTAAQADVEEKGKEFCSQARELFKEPGKASTVLGASINRGLGELVETLGPLLDGLLDVNAQRRWTATRLSQAATAGLLVDHVDDA